MNLSSNQEIHDRIRSHMESIERLEGRMARDSYSPDEYVRALRTVRNLKAQVMNLRGLLHLMASGSEA